MSFETTDNYRPSEIVNPNTQETSILGDLFGGLLGELMETLVEEIKAFAEEHELTELIDLITSDEAVAVMTALGLVEVVAVIKLYKALEQKGEVNANETTFSPDNNDQHLVKHFDFTPDSNMTFGGVELLAGEKTNMMVKVGGEESLETMLSEANGILATAQTFEGKSFLVVPDSFGEITPKEQNDIKQALDDANITLVVRNMN